jgi:hypothetical protein
VKNEQAQELINSTELGHAALNVVVDKYLEAARSKEPETAQFVTWLYFLFLQRRQAVVLLLRDARPWDAEILLGSMREATFRILFMCLSAPAERQERLEEYWQVLWASNELERANLAATNAAQHGRGGTERAVREGATVTKGRQAAVRLAVPEMRRLEVGRKWSLAEIASWLDANSEKIGRPPMFKASLFHHGIASNFLHGDPGAGVYIEERANCKPEELESLEDAHLGRMLSDVLGFQAMIAFALASCFSLDRAFLLEALQAIAAIQQDLEEIQ